MGEEAYKALQTGVLRSFTWQKGLIALAVLVGFVVVAKLIGHLIRRSLARRGRGGGAAFALSKLLTYFLVFAGALAALGFLGVPTGTMLLTSSALLIGLGFSLQHVAQDFVAGIVILVERSIRRNDFVTFGDTKGTVVQIGLRSTQLLTRDGTALFVPNHLLTSSEVSNHSNPHERARLHVKVPVGFRESVDHVRETLLGVADSQDQILSDPAPMVRFEEILDTHFHFTLIVWVKEPVTTMRVASKLRFAIAHAFAQRGIQFPTPELELRPSADSGQHGGGPYSNSPKST
jgi:potassium efflux system protein